MCSLVMHVNDLVLQFAGQWRHLSDMQIRLKGKNIYANHQNKYEQCVEYCTSYYIRILCI